LADAVSEAVPSAAKPESWETTLTTWAACVLYSAVSAAP
jgi:hypothetical protein